MEIHVYRQTDEVNEEKKNKGRKKEMDRINRGRKRVIKEMTKRKVEDAKTSC